MKNNLSSLFNQRNRIKRRYIDCNFPKDNFMQHIFQLRLKTDSNYKQENFINFCDEDTKKISLDKIITKETKKSKNNCKSPLLNKNTFVENKEMNNTKEVETKALIKKNKKSNSSSSSSDSDNNNNKNLSFYNDDKYNPSRINDILRRVIANHYNLAPDTLNLIENSADGNYLYYSISFHCFNNFNHQREIPKIIANKLNGRSFPMVTITNNLV